MSAISSPSQPNRRSTPRPSKTHAAVVENLKSRLARYENWAATDPTASPSAHSDRLPDTGIDGHFGPSPPSVSRPASSRPASQRNGSLSQRRPPAVAIPTSASLSSSSAFSSRVQELFGQSPPFAGPAPSTTAPAEFATARRLPPPSAPPLHAPPTPPLPTTAQDLRPPAAASPVSGGQVPAASLDHIVPSLPPLPSNDDLQCCVRAVGLFMGTTQHYFDQREFADRLCLFCAHRDDPVQYQTPWFLELLLVVATGKLMLGDFESSDGPGGWPGARLFAYAQNHLPTLSELRVLGRLGIEILALVAVYLQNTYRKEDAYIYISTALRLAVLHGFHLSSTAKHLLQSELVDTNRLWWSVYMQEKRLSAATGNPSNISDDLITVDLPDDSPGFSAAAPLRTSVEIARVTGRILATLYGDGLQSEASFITNAQEVVQAIYDISREIPSPPKFEAPAEFRFDDAAYELRRSGSLHMMLFQTTILTTRPIMLYVARCILGGQDRVINGDDNLAGSSLGKLCRTCSEAARRLLSMLARLKRHDLFAICGFYDFDAIFSAAFIMILTAIYNSACRPEDRIAHHPPGLADAIEILDDLARRGNAFAAEKLVEVRHVWALLSESIEMDATAGMSAPQSQPPQEQQQRHPQIMPDRSADTWPTFDPAPTAHNINDVVIADLPIEAYYDYWNSLSNNQDWSLTGENISDFAEFGRYMADMQ
ncbi:Transcription factor [Niveomyces insectorum RCEF 264]|uniref:Transcription factor n=1 Tax=Niveomyces insectorum RCEF 264 TaxID=1081102 RepID=A0A167T9E2_9HYPO|nr:Transcription factor [Niveomyces insectorum RCEF 264]